jgi:amidohydrolase
MTRMDASASLPAPLLSAAHELQPDLVALRRAIHAEPELGLLLPRTQRRVLDALEGLGLELQVHERTSGIEAILRGERPGPCVLLRADMDALPLEEPGDLEFRSRIPGAMHACGHDAHTAMLVGAAHLLAQRRAELRGSVRLVFQPGEESAHGALRMIEDGLLEREPRPDVAFALHVAPQLAVGRLITRAGILLVACDDFEIDVRGAGGHASMPHDTLDPIPVACQIVQALQLLVTRRVDAFDPAVLTVSQISAGTAVNVIPERASLRGTVRSASAATRERVRAGLHEVAGGIASAHGMQAEVRWIEGYPALRNDAAATAFACAVVRDLLGPASLIEVQRPFMGCEDFAYLLEHVPGAVLLIGVRPDVTPDGSPPAPCHSNRMLLNESALPLGAAVHANLALRWLEQNT